MMIACFVYGLFICLFVCGLLIEGITERKRESMCSEIYRLKWRSDRENRLQNQLWERDMRDTESKLQHNQGLGT